MRANHNNWDRTLDGESSLAEFRHIIQIAMGWVDEYLHQFHIYGKDYRISYDGGFLFSDDDSLVLLDDFDVDSGDRFTYTYNFYANCTHDIRIEMMASASQRPHCLSGNGLVSPPRYTEFDLIARFSDFNGYHADLQPHRRPARGMSRPNGWASVQRTLR